MIQHILHWFSNLTFSTDEQSVNLVPVLFLPTWTLGYRTQSIFLFSFQWQTRYKRNDEQIAFNKKSPRKQTDLRRRDVWNFVVIFLSWHLPNKRQSGNCLDKCLLFLLLKSIFKLRTATLWAIVFPGSFCPSGPLSWRLQLSAREIVLRMVFFPFSVSLRRRIFYWQLSSQKGESLSIVLSRIAGEIVDIREAAEEVAGTRCHLLDSFKCFRCRISVEFAFHYLARTFPLLLVSPFNLAFNECERYRFTYLPI